MKTINLIRKTGKDGRLRLNIPVEMPETTVEVTVVMNLIYKEKKNRYDFNDLAGRLNWKGDAVLEQRRLRDEWK